MLNYSSAIAGVSGLPTGVRADPKFPPILPRAALLELRRPVTALRVPANAAALIN
jgi:hypothetical protein